MDRGDLETYAFALYIILFLITVLVHYFSKSAKRKTAEEIRSEYRRAWVEQIIKKNDYKFLMEVLKNNISGSAAMISGTIIAFGFVLTAHSLTLLSGIKVIAIILLLSFTLFSILLEIRILTYIPILFATPEKIIKKNEKKNKVVFILELLDESYNRFSESIRALLFIIALLVSFYDIYIFIIATVVLTFILLRDDIDPRGHIRLF